MRKILFTLLTMVLFTVSVNAQFYIKAGVGGGFGTASSYSMLYNYSYSPSNTGQPTLASTAEVVPVAFGKGFKAGIGFGYMFAPYIGIDLGIRYCLGFNTKATFESAVPGATSYTTTVRGNMLQIIPGVVITAGLEKVNPYARIGIIIGPMANIRYDNDRTNGSTGTEIKTLGHFYGGVSVGFNAAAGVDFNLSKLIALFVEADFSQISYAPKHFEITEYTVDGVDKLSTLTIREKKTDFKKNLDLSTNPPDDQPDQQLMNSYPYDNIGINFGVKIKFGGK